MKKKLLSILLTLCLVLTLLPSTALAIADYKLYVGNTLVGHFSTDPSESEMNAGTTYYWKAAESGDDAYAETGSADDNLFSVSFDESDESFTLTLNGVNITSYSRISSYDYGIFSNTSLNICLTSGTANSIDMSSSSASESNGIFVGGTLTTSGNGSLSALGGTRGIQSWGAEASLNITGGTISASGTAYGILVDGNVTISGGTVSAAASGDTSDGIAATGNLTVSDGSVTASGNRYALGVNGSTSVTNASYKFRTNTSATAPATDYTLFPGTEFANSGTYKYVEITSTPKVYVSGDNADSGTVLVSGVEDRGNISYWLNDGSGSITSAGASAENYNVKYNEATQTLTLKDAAITRYHSDLGAEHQHGIFAQSDLNIVLEGSSVIGTTGSPVGTAGIQCGGNLSLSAASGGSLSIVSGEYGIDAHGDVSIDSGTVSISAVRLGIKSTGGFSLTDGVVSVTSERNGIETNRDIKVTGAQTVLNVTACAATDNRGYGIGSSNSILIVDAAVSVTKNGSRGDAVWSRDDIRISGSSIITIVDWSTSEGDDCGLHSNVGNVAIGGSVQMDICSRRIGIYARESVYLGYVWNGSAYAASGSPTVKINSSGSIGAITPGIDDDFSIGINGIKASNGGISMSGGTLTAIGSEKALNFAGEALTLPSSYKYKSNTDASAPDGSYTFGTYTTYGNDKFVEIVTAQAPSGGYDEYYSPPPTIAVTETSSGLFSGAQGAVRAEANMTGAFPSSVEVKVTDTDESGSGFGLGIGNTVYPFDISLYIKGTNTKTKPKNGYAVTISLPIPDNLLGIKEQLSIAHKADDGSVAVLASQLRQINGIWYLVFEATEFSPYALVLNRTGAYDKTAGLPCYTDANGNLLFIGFSAKGKYVAPSGVTVLFKENTKTFTDIGSHWAKECIGFVTEREIFLGTGSGAFSPDSGMTRAMFAAVIGRLYERSFGEIKGRSAHSFTDCDYGDYYGKYIVWAEENGILTGYGNGLFGPGDAVTREQMAATIYRFADFLGDLPSDMGTALKYPDADSISSYAKAAALYCQSTGIITGRDGGKLFPQATATRAETAVILKRFIENILN